MPVTMTTVKYSATLDQNYVEDEFDHRSSSSSSSSSCAGVDQTINRIDDCSITSGVTMRSDYQNSSFSGSLSGENSRKTSLFELSTEFIPTRTVVKSTIKPAFNPLQFIKTPTCSNYKSKAGQSSSPSTVTATGSQQHSVDQIRKVKEMVKEEEEAWQSNLDNWKSKRRQISHQTVQRAEEIKLIEEIEHDRHRKKSKTFMEMIQERSKRRDSSSKLPVYGSADDDEDDRSVHGDGGGADDIDDIASDIWKNYSNNNNDNETDTDYDQDGHQTINNHKDASFDSSGSDGVFHDDIIDKKIPEDQLKLDEPEFTFDKAIRSYVEFAESCKKGNKLTSSPLVDKKVTPNVTTLQDSQQSDSKVGSGGQEMTLVVSLKRNNESIKDFGFITKINNAVIVESIASGGAADLAGLHVNDQLLAINGESTSNRTHSAILFAVKQAVYTGRLELLIYRPKNQELHQEHGKQRNKNKEMGLISSSMKVVAERRSLFESSMKSTSEKSLNRRSFQFDQDMSIPRVREKLASFENLDDLQRSVHRYTSAGSSMFQRKLSSFMSMDSLNDTGSKRLNSRHERRSDVTSAGENFHNNSSSFDNQSSLERTRSCDFLDDVGGFHDQLLSADVDISEDFDLKRRLSIDTEDKSMKLIDYLNNNQLLIEIGDKQEEKSGFALAMDLQETPITDSRLTSPINNSNIDVNINAINKNDSIVSNDSRHENDFKLGNSSDINDDGDSDYDLPLNTSIILAEPPKEKPPPPPTDISSGHSNAKVQRMLSTKRIRKEICRRRSDFLGIEADALLHDFNDVNLKLTPSKMSLLMNSKLSVTAMDEDEMTRKEREIIEDLEKLEKSNDLMVGENSIIDDERKLREREELLRRQEGILQIEKEKLQMEQERLLREKEAYQKQIEQHHRVGNGSAAPICEVVIEPSITSNSNSNEKSRMDNLTQPSETPPTEPRIKSPTAITPPSNRVGVKQNHTVGHLVLQMEDECDRKEAELEIETSRPASVVGRPAGAALSRSSKQMIHALSASPRIRLKDGDQWVQHHHQNDNDNDSGYNRQHWLVQEAEMRHLIQAQDRQSSNNNNNNSSNNNSNNNNNNINIKSYNNCPMKTTSSVYPTTNVDRSTSSLAALPISYKQPPPPPPPQQKQQQQQQQHYKPTVVMSGALLCPSDQNSNINQAWHLSKSSQPLPPATSPRISPLMQPSSSKVSSVQPLIQTQTQIQSPSQTQLKSHQVNNDSATILSVSGKKKCSHCSQELGRGAAMIIESLHLFYHIDCFKCCVCHVQLGNGTSGADVRVRNHKLHCHNCYSNDEGLKFSKV